MSRLVLRSIAERDLAEAQAWYESKRAGLGDKFVAAVEETFEVIKQFPQGFPVIVESVRRASVRKFPYGVFYVVHRDAIRVFAVYHERRDPKGWLSRV